MEKLNELAEQAKFVADWHGSDWSSALCQDKDGKQAHEIICESRGESVISTGSNSNEASWLCDYLELCSPENILAIAEAFRALEQQLSEITEQYVDRTTALSFATQSVEAAEAKLAELEKQEPVAWLVLNSSEGYVERNPDVVSFLEAAGLTKCKPLFTRPAPAAPVFGWLRVVSGQSFQIMEGPQRPPDRSGNGAGPWFAIYRQPPAPAADLAKLVPDELTWSYHDNITQGEVNSWNDCRAAILRNIEGAGRND